MCKDLCFKNSLGENCLHSCGCVLGNNIIYLLLTNGQLFRSTDMGKIWDDESIGLLESFERFTKLNKHLNSLKSNEEFLLIKDIIPNPQNHDILWILGKSSLNWKTEDAGDTYGIWYIETEGHILKVSSIFLHPTRNNSLLATSLSPEICENWAAELSSDCKQALYVSHDNGKQWDLVDKNVKKFGWGNSGKFFNKINTRFHQHYVFGTAKNISEEINPITTVDWSTIYFSKSNGRNEVMMVCNRWWLKKGEGFGKCNLLLDNLHSFHFFRNYIYLAFYTKEKEVTLNKYFTKIYDYF